MEKDILDKLCSDGLSQNKIAEILEVSQTTVRYWLSKYGLKTTAKSKSLKFNYSDEKNLSDIVSSSLNYSDCLRKMGFEPRGSSQVTLKKYIAIYNIDTSHFETHTARNRRLAVKYTLSSYLNSDLVNKSGQKIRSLMIEEGHEDRCGVCGQGNSWNGMDLVLQIDHIDGDPKNNKLHNLRIICPNCHTQTKTFGNKRRKPKHCGLCGGNVSTNGSSSFCSKDCFYSSKKKSTDTRFLEKIPSDYNYGYEFVNSSFKKIGVDLGISRQNAAKMIKRNFYDLYKARKERVKG